MEFNPKQKKYNYTTGGAFTLSGIDYVGYFNVVDGVARTNRNNGVLLTPTSNIVADLNQYKLGPDLIFTDRLIVDTINLPNSLDELLIPINENVTNITFISHLKRLYENTLYLYSQLNIASNDIPNGYLYWIGVSAAESLSANEQKWNPKDIITTNYPYSDFGYPSIDESVKTITIKSDNSLDYITFSVSETTFSVISSKTDKSITSAIFATSAIDTNSDKYYSKIEDISIANNRYIFIADSGNNAIYKYDISGYTLSDNTLFNRKFLVDVVGIYGDVKSRIGFDRPTIIESNDSRLYVYDSGNKCVKTFTLDFAWVNTYLFDVDIDLVDIAYNDFHEKVFVLAQKENFDYILLIFDKDFKTKLAEYDIDEKYEEIIDGVSTKIGASRAGRIKYVIDPRETLKGIAFSKQDSNIFYIYSNYSVYKKFITRPVATVGKWSITKAGISWGYIWNFIDIKWDNLFVTWNTISGSDKENVDIIDMNIIPTDNNYDDIFVSMRAGNPGAFKLIYCNEYTFYDTALKSANIDVYNTTRFGTLDDEYVNAFTINKELYKQSFNILALRNLLKGKFTGSYNRSGNLIYEQYDYITKDELDSIQVNSIEDFYVHENEHVSSSTINRCIRKIYGLQTAMLDIVKTRIKNITPTISLTGLNILNIE